MSLCTISGSAQSPAGSLIEGDVIIIRPRVGAAFADGAVAVIPKTTRVVVGAGSLVSFSLYSGSYVARTVTERGVDEWSMSVPNAASATFADCLTAVTEQTYSQTELAVLAASGLITYTTSAEGIANTTNGEFFMVPAAPMGLTIFENVSGVATSRGGLLLQQLLSNGSAAAPSVSFASDPDTGIFLNAANQLGFSTGAVQRMVLTSTGLLTGSVVTQTALDTTTGRLTKVGDFGIGGGIGGVPDIIVADIDAITTPAGFYQTTSGTTGVFPVGESFFGQLIVFRYNNLNFTQIWMSALGDTLYTRRYRSPDVPAFSPWRPLFSRHNILGAVSQVAGVPTGRVIERGSNANGEFVRFADGTQICTHTDLSAANADTADGALFRSANVLWTFPATFIAAPAVNPAQASDTDCFVSSQTPTTTNVNARVRSTVTKAGAITFGLVATGRWF
jgi:hypothetical protein